MVKMIDNYTLLQVIGQGNYGKVYRAKNTKTNQQYAIKIIPTQKLHQNSKLQQCTMNEVQTLTIIGQTQHIIMYYEMLKTKNNYYFVYQFCNGGTLMEMLAKEHHLDQSKALEIFKQLLQAFKVLNRQNIMHRDLKPENIFFSDNKVKLGDFGFCKGLRPQENLTKTMLGSPIYMAPEVLKGEAYSTKADIWSLGVILYEMLYGVCPFQSSSIAMLINTINSQEISLPSNIKISEKTQQLLRKLLTKDYFRRIGWIELFNWFDNDESQQKENVFKSSTANRSLLDKKASLVEEWASKNRLSEINVKERSVSQDITKKQKVNFDLGSLENISPSHFHEKNNPFTPKLGEECKNGDTSESATKQQKSNQKSFSAIRQPLGGASPFQAYKKTASVPKRQNGINQEGNYGQSSSYKPESNKKIFYSQNYQNIFTTPITEKNQKMNDRSIEIPDKEPNALHESTVTQVGLSQNIGSKNRVNQRLSGNNQSLMNSRANSSTMGSFLGNKSFKDMKSENSKVKRKELLQIHEECLNVLKETFQKLQQRREKFLKVGYIVMTVILERLKEIVRLINVVEIDLLDISSLINYEIIQVDKMVIDIKEQLESNLESVPLSFEEIKETFEVSEETLVIKQFIRKRIAEAEQEVSFEQRGQMVQNISIVGMLPYKQQRQQKDQDTAMTYDDQGSSKLNKGQYYTTNEFAEYYKNLMGSKDMKQKTSNSKIAIP